MPENEEKTLETPVTPTPAVIDNPEMEDVEKAAKDATVDIYMQIQQASIREDYEARADADLRILMVELVERIGELITEFGEKLQQAHSPKEHDPFEIDACKDLIAWQLAEFVTLAQYPRDDETYEYTVKGGQFTRLHSMFWFQVEETYRDPDALLFVRKPRKPAPETDEEADQDEDVTGGSTMTPPIDDQPDDAPELRLVS